MATDNVQRNKIIRRAVLRQPEAVPETTVHLWKRLAAELILIIGEGGFQSLYARSLHLTSARFSWVAAAAAQPHADSRFDQLNANLKGRDAAEASEASIALLTAFIDILAVLIGELLTASILRSAWGDEAMDTAAKDFDNE